MKKSNSPHWKAILRERENIARCLGCGQSKELQWAGKGTSISYANTAKMLKEGVMDGLLKDIWNRTIPKAALLMWRMRWERLQTLNRLEHRGMETNSRVQPESILHVFFNCRSSEDALRRCMHNVAMQPLQGQQQATRRKLLRKLMA